MASTAAAPELAQALPTPLPSRSLGGRLRVVGLRAAAAAHRNGIARHAWPLAVAGSATAGFGLAVVAHELLVVLFAFGLAAVTGLSALQDLLMALPVNYIYASAMLRYAGQLDVSGLAVAGAPGVLLADRLP